MNQILNYLLKGIVLTLATYFLGNTKKTIWQYTLEAIVFALVLLIFDWFTMGGYQIGGCGCAPTGTQLTQTGGNCGSTGSNCGSAGCF